MNLKRRTGVRSPQKKLVVFCEGTVTEKKYIGGIRSDLRAGWLEATPAGGNPLNIVECAIAETQSRRQIERLPRSVHDQVWCMFDVEAPTPHPNLREAMTLAENNGIQCAVSNPCFELWAILHDRYQRGYMTTAEACSALEAILPDYSRGKKVIPYASLKDRYEKAKERAQGLDAIHDETQSATRNPSSSVWRLVDAILDFNAEMRRTRS